MKCLSNFKHFQWRKLVCRVRPFRLGHKVLTHWGRVTHICVSKLIIIGSDNGLSPGRRQAIIWTNAGILLIRPLGTNFNEMLIKILTFSFMKMRLKVSSAKWRQFRLGLNVLTLHHGENTSFPLLNPNAFRSDTTVTYCQPSDLSKTKLICESGVASLLHLVKALYRMDKNKN